MDLSKIASSCSRPCRQISSETDLLEFLDSPCHAQFMQFILDINNSIRGLPLVYEKGVPGNLSKGIQWISKLLNQLDSWIDLYPPEPNKGRFGNPAFRLWLGKLTENVDIQMRELLGLSGTISETDLEQNTAELSEYLINSFGNYQRIDYGTGHEAHFIAWLYCLTFLGVFSVPEDLKYIGLAVFYQYILLMRRLQSTYWLEPAGSHGVWGLDDYHFLPFLFGSSQLVDHPHISPKSIHDTEVLVEAGDHYMYLSCIRFINSVKTASLQWHSPLLNDISGVRSWEKVNSGMIRMYQADVLSKLPIMQHFLFGRILSFSPSSRRHKDSSSNEDVHKNADTDTHIHRGDCCGNPIPSVFAAAQEQSRHLQSLPFD